MHYSIYIIDLTSVSQMFIKRVVVWYDIISYCIIYRISSIWKTRCDMFIRHLPAFSGYDVLLYIWYNRPYTSCCYMQSAISYFMSEYCKLHGNYNTNPFVTLCGVAFLQICPWRPYIHVSGYRHNSSIVNNNTNLNMIKYWCILVTVLTTISSPI